MTFLIAEDNSRMRDVISRFIRQRIPDDHTIYEAADGSEAIEIYNRFGPDWVLMDILMEPLDGLAASRAILTSHPDARIIILTNFDDVAYRNAARELGTHAFVLKERLSEVLEIVQRAQAN